MLQAKLLYMYNNFVRNFRAFSVCFIIEFSDPVWRWGHFSDGVHHYMYTQLTSHLLLCFVFRFHQSYVNLLKVPMHTHTHTHKFNSMQTSNRRPYGKIIDEAFQSIRCDRAYFAGKSQGDKKCCRALSNICWQNDSGTIIEMSTRTIIYI